MRTQLCILLAVGMMLGSPAAHAQTYSPDHPVCMHVFTGPGGGDYFDCSFVSLPQCRASASGRAAMCDVNPYYGGRQIGSRRHPHRHPRHHRRSRR
ncbi:MAG: DUF3551 domain-containing protein [Alphaproteobacteria bacterium]|nr:DUF3551 domain-containing protein [Alphaproteobacteria bacterium]